MAQRLNLSGVIFHWLNTRDNMGSINKLARLARGAMS